MNRSLPFESNPAYGSGIFHRNLLIRYQAHGFQIAMEDDIHSFRIFVTHDQQRISSVDAKSVRIPFTTCSGAEDILQQFVGTQLEGSIDDLVKRINVREHCTHLYDILLAALFFYPYKNNFDQQLFLQMQISDETKLSPSRCTIRCNDQLLHDWRLADLEFQSPLALRGKPVMRGFHAWAVEAFSGVEWQAAMLLQRAIMVSQARRYELPNKDALAAQEKHMIGACHTYTLPNANQAFRTGNPLRNLDASPERVKTMLEN